MKKLVCIHGHFYQPPRENPWLEEIEREPSAAPHHDWNARITEECYAPNAAARILDENMRVARLYDNYARMSFNVGPTLLSWMERHAPDTLQAIVDADIASRQRLGQGNAIAQVYNHVIMPLANERDKKTQVRWGLADFRHRFGRPARGIWLAETAVDAATLDVLAEEGVDFTILSPYQARRYRLQGRDWVDCADGSIPTGRAYRYTTKTGKVVRLFFYDGVIARGIAFERLLSDASHVTAAIHGAWAARRAPVDEPWLIHTATDGETYGHHFRFGDMALAATFARLEGDPDVEIVNYATFLDRYGATGDVELHPVSAWSCAHGVGRWERDCGCRMNPDPSWNQRWRTGLRAALNHLRDELAPFYERRMQAFVDDPWQVRDRYIEVVLDRGRRDAFVQSVARRALDPAERVRFFQLLEMQRCCLLMFTSCGWFFDDISGAESVILMKYAARAIGLAARAGFDDGARSLERAFLQELARAESNVKKPDGTRPTGRDVYLSAARPSQVDADRVTVSLALLCANGRPAPSHVAAWRVTQHEEHSVDDAPIPCVAGRVHLVDERTGEDEAVAFAVVGFGGIDWRGVLLPERELPRLRQRLETLPDVSALARVLDEEVGGGARGFTLREAPADLRDDIAAGVLARRVDLTDAVLAELLLSERALLRGVVALGGALSPSLRTLVGHALSRRARDVVDELLATTGPGAPFVRRLRTILDDGAELAVQVDLAAPARDVERAVAHALRQLLRAEGGPVVADAVEAVTRLLDVLALVAGDRPLSTVLPLVARVVSRAHVDERLKLAAAHLLPALDRACRTAFVRDGEAVTSRGS